MTSWPFDLPAARRINAARQAFLHRLLVQLPDQPRRTALDAGCGVGYFSSFLRGLGFEVVGFDGRPDTVAEARRRFPHTDFRLADVESPEIRDFGHFDLVLCFGLLYHTENPFRVLRNLHAVTRSLLVIETMCIPGRAPALLLRDEGVSVDQGLRRVAFHPTEAVVVAMLYRAGFPHVYRSTYLPEHPDFQPALFQHRKRTVVVASQAPLSARGLRRAPDLLWSGDPWLTRGHRLRLAAGQIAQGVRTLAADPTAPIRFLLKQIWNLALPFAPLPVRLPSGIWWLARNDFLGDQVVLRTYELAEQEVFAALLRPGMTVFDVGAHQGFYTLLASKRVGPSGLVVAFEPSPRERRHLALHLRLNRCQNVRVEGVALGVREEEGQLFVVLGRDTGMNSLRRPDVGEPVAVVTVPVTTLDRYSAERGAPSPDILKIDAEGAELDILRGAAGMLRRSPRPVILCEVQAVRTAQWGYRAEEIVQSMSGLGYRWFLPQRGGRLAPLAGHALPPTAPNLVAVPEERLQEVTAILRAGDSVP